MKINQHLSLALSAAIQLLAWFYLYNHFSSVVLVLEIGSVKLPESFISESLLYGMCFNAVIFYLNYSYLITKYMAHRTIYYLVISALLITLITLAETMLDIAFMDTSQFQSIYALWLVLFLFNAKVHLSFWLLSGILKTSFNWIAQEKLKETIKSQQTETELAMLKSQVHPHFLFNTLNTLYSSAYEFGDNETANGIGKLSHLLRYMLYETKASKVLLESEIEYIENYIDLLKLRFSNDVTVTFTIEGDIADYTIAPMMLITLVENAFKHGISPAIKTKIKISLTREKDTLIFQVINAKLRERAKSELEGSSGGQGLANLIKRLEMIYPKKHHFYTFQEDGDFIARLELL